MASQRITIGALARRSGVPVKTLRFYSDEGLLPPVDRTRGGYRLYAEDAVVRLDTIRTLREAGVGLAAIKAIFARELSLRDALRLRLCAVEAHITSLQQVAAALRTTLRSEPDEADIRRLCTVTRLTSEQRKAVIEDFTARIAEGVEDAWKRDIIVANTPRLPEDPSPAQLDAWIELAQLVQDEGFVAAMRASAAESWRPGLDLAAHQAASAEAVAAAQALLARGVAPESDEARPVVERLLTGLAGAMGRPVDAALRREVRDQYARQDPRTARYWQLVGVLAAQDAWQWPDAEWKWLAAAMLHHLAPA